MKILKFFKCLVFGSVLGKVAFAGFGPLPGDFVDVDALSREFERKNQQLSPDTLAKFISAAEAHNRAANAINPQLWFDVLELYGDLEFGCLANGRFIDLTMESYSVAECIAWAFEELSELYPNDESYKEQASSFMQHSEELRRRAQEEAYYL